jgi:hypothetical protein
MFEVTVVDMAVHSDNEITTHKLLQADMLLEHLTDEHQLSLIKQTEEFAGQLRGLANQLYCQMVATIALIRRVLENASMYYSQRQPKELGAFHWVIDGKSPDGITTAEELWKNFSAPFIQSASLREPIGIFAEGDYSYFDEKFGTKIPEYLKEHGVTSEEGTSLNKIMWEDIRFSRSNEDFGLQLVDVLVNATRRALIGNLKYDGWRELSRLMFEKHGQSVELISLGTQLKPFPKSPYSDVVRALSRHTKEMLIPRYRSRSSSQG